MADLENEIKLNWAIWIHIKTANKWMILNFIFSISPLTLKKPSNIKIKKWKCQLKIWNKVTFNPVCLGLSPELYQSNYPPIEAELDVEVICIENFQDIPL